jgi:hypothetical protein
VVSGAAGKGATFLCVPGQLDGRTPGEGAPKGEIVEWEPPRRVTTRLELTPETWTTSIELAEAGTGTAVTVTVTHEPRRGGRFLHRLQGPGMRRLVQRTVDGELDKLPAHIDQVTTG